jgi:hypothetical protein
VSQPAHCSKTVLREFVSIAAGFHAAQQLKPRLLFEGMDWQDEESWKGIDMNLRNRKNEAGKVGYIILWLLGVPFSVLVLIFLLRSC